MVSEIDMARFETHNKKITPKNVGTGRDRYTQILDTKVLEGEAAKTVRNVVKIIKSVSFSMQ